MDAPDRTPASLADRLVKRFLLRDEPVGEEAAATRAMLPRAMQLSLPLGGEHRDEHGLALPSLFRGARQIGAVLSYEQPSLDQIIPDALPPAGAPQDRLMLPGGLGLVLHDGANDSLAFDWMHWGERMETRLVAERLEPTVNVADLRKATRAARKLAKNRCIVPLLRYSVPVRDGDMWAHRWISPAEGQVVCAAGIWIAERASPPRFALVTSDADSGSGTEPGGPMLLAESALLTWLRAPLREAVAELRESFSR